MSLKRDGVLFTDCWFDFNLDRPAGRELKRRYEIAASLGKSLML